MASVQEYCKKLTTDQLRSVLAEHENSEEPFSVLIVQTVLAILTEREKLG